MAVNDIVMGAAGASGPATYIEDVFSTYLYAGNGSTQTITNGIDLSGKGGLVWQKNRTSAATDHYLIDTVRGNDSSISSNLADAAGGGYSAIFTSFNSNGFSVSSAYSLLNVSGQNYASWSFREQPKFFDVVTYTGTGSNTTIAHNLGSVPGCIIVKRTDSAANWQVYHRSLANTEYLVLNTTAAKATGATRWNSTTPTSSVFSLGTDATVNASGGTYVAYLFAHDAGGFGVTGTDNVISCGSFTTNGSGVASVTLGYEPQWVMTKYSSGVGNWHIWDVMRGMIASGGANPLYPNTSTAEDNYTAYNCIAPNATGFTVGSGGFAPNTTVIYIAIRRPMKTPTTGTEVFDVDLWAGNNTNRDITTGFPVDMFIWTSRTKGLYGNNYVASRLIGNSGPITNGDDPAYTFANNAFLSNNGFDSNTAMRLGTNDQTNDTGQNHVGWSFKRSPGFFDVVCWTGNGTWSAKNHNLTVTPELIIQKSRSNTQQWYVWVPGSSPSYGVLNTTAAFTPFGSAYTANDTTFTPAMDQNSYTFVAYLFATFAGVSKVGSYTGTGATLNINAGFTTGARFVMIKRTDSTGNWFVWDTARGMVSGTDPRLALNSTAAESNADWVYTASSGFQIVTTDASVNASGGTYIYLAIA